ncbi:protein of unknown function [Virgibacillus subterraneus]|uniref:DUF3899 domain-containing protein n=1 Tax=Virgibacillus subterraneus TaxID=621109 RepID=A0A1H8ZZT7_9BACI|nr:DUF3899 domain-containing protein [Virgibacillus subterraneus]SEP69757.1 protein of unknown function [Virgibacillus subterraneus]
MYRKNWFILILNISIIFIMVYLRAPVFSLVHFINMTFYFSLIYIVIFLAMYTMKGGFYDGVTFGFRRFRSVMSKQSDYLEEWKEKPLPSSKVSQRFYKFARFQSIALLTLLVALVLFYYGYQ